MYRFLYLKDLLFSVFYKFALDILSFSLCWDKCFIWYASAAAWCLVKICHTVDRRGALNLSSRLIWFIIHKCFSFMSWSSPLHSVDCFDFKMTIRNFSIWPVAVKKIMDRFHHKMTYLQVHIKMPVSNNTDTRKFSLCNENLRDYHFDVYTVQFYWIIKGIFIIASAISSW